MSIRLVKNGYSGAFEVTDDEPGVKSFKIQNCGPKLAAKIKKISMDLPKNGYLGVFEVAVITNLMESKHVKVLKFKMTYPIWQQNQLTQKTPNKYFQLNYFMNFGQNLRSPGPIL